MKVKCLISALLLLRPAIAAKYNTAVPACEELCNPSKRCGPVTEASSCACLMSGAKACAQFCDGPPVNEERICRHSNPMIPADPPTPNPEPPNPEGPEMPQEPKPKPSEPVNPEDCECPSSSCLAKRGQIGWCRCVNRAIDACKQKCPGKSQRPYMRCCDGCIVLRDAELAALTYLSPRDIAHFTSASNSDSLKPRSAEPSADPIPEPVPNPDPQTLTFSTSNGGMRSGGTTLTSFSDGGLTGLNPMSGGNSYSGGSSFSSGYSLPALKRCSNDNQCPRGELCQSQQCVGAECYLRPASESQKQRCPSGQVCVQKPSPDGRVVFDVPGMCAVASMTCRSNNECPSGWMCQTHPNGDGPLCGGRNGCGVCQHYGYR